MIVPDFEPKESGSGVYDCTFPPGFEDGAETCQKKKLRTFEITVTPRERDASISLGFPLMASH